jgi:hypothetical protein
MTGVAMEPSIQLLVTAAELSAIMLSPKWLGKRVGHWLLEDTGPRKQIPQPRWDTRGPVKQLVELPPILLIENESGSIGDDSMRLGHRSVTDEVAVAGASRVARRTDDFVLLTVHAQVPAMLTGLLGWLYIHGMYSVQTPYVHATDRLRLLDQRPSRHRLRLGDSQEVEGGGGDIGEDAVVAELEALCGNDQGHWVERVGGVG